MASIFVLVNRASLEVFCTSTPKSGKKAKRFAEEWAFGLIEVGQVGNLYSGPTGVDKMKYVTGIHGGKKKGDSS